MLETRRLRLRAFVEQDFESLLELMSDNEVMRFTGFKQPQSVERVRELLTQWQNEASESLGVWAVVGRDSGELLGWSMLKKTSSETPELGYMFLKRHWGRGFATELTRALLDHAFSTLNFSRVVAVTTPDNLASIRVLEKNGMSKESPVTKNEESLRFIAANPHQLIIEKFNPEKHYDFVIELTEMLHAAYRPLAEDGMKYLATHQSPEVTLRRLLKGDSFFGFMDGRLISTITIVSGGSGEPCAWYQRQEVSFFTQFAVHPEFQGRGIGHQLMDFAESFARDNGAQELSLDTSEHAHALISMYKKRGYRHVEWADWSVTNYRSVVLSKALHLDRLRFRLADPKESSALTELALRSKAHWNYSADYLNGCRGALQVNRADIENWPVIVGERESEIVGFFALKKVDGESRLDHLWIEPKHIGQGHGRLFFREAVERARNLGWKSFRLAADPPAQGFYEKMGMKKVGEVQSRIKPDLFLPHMELHLNADLF